MRNTHIHNFEMKSIQSNDEIGMLERGYNSMMQRIKGLIEEEYQREIEVKNAQLMALQAQINPHFLNNTLHLIGGMALSKDAPEIYQITRVIGDLLRYSISTDGDMVSIEDELKHVQNYIFIQEQRFVGRCKVDVVIDESARSSRLPKFTLQPMVENAFEHGLQRKLGTWKIEVRIKRIGERIALMIKDEGVGLSEHRLHELRTELRGEQKIRLDKDESRKRRGIGLRNVDARLKLQFGERYGVRLYSRARVGTLIVMMIPVTRTEVDQHDA
ncbi:MAG: sensor histidine kinase [Paenibacillaceae bacterium]